MGRGAFETKSRLVHLEDVEPRPAILARWEHVRTGPALWFVECFAEAMGTFLYTFAGAGSSASWILGNVLNTPGLGSLFQIGVAYAVGIVLAILVCMPTSGGHLSPGFTICAWIMGHVTAAKAARLIVAQIMGVYIACLVVYAQNHDLIMIAEEVLHENGTYDTTMFTSTGLAGIMAFYVSPTSNLGYTFFNEFVADFVIALVVFVVIEPTGHSCPPVMMPWVIALTCAVAVWGFGPSGVATDTARDVGGRLAAMTIWGRQAAGGPYSAIAALTNIPASLVAGVVAEFIFKDSRRTITPAYHAWGEAQLAYNARVKKVDGFENSSSTLAPDEGTVV